MCHVKIVPISTTYGWKIDSIYFTSYFTGIIIFIVRILCLKIRIIYEINVVSC